MNMKKLFIILIKYMPIIQMLVMLMTNIIYYFDLYEISYICDFIFGNSFITTFLLFICSFMFGFCKWHRIIITTNFINILIANIDAIKQIPINDIQLLIIYHIVSSIGIIIAVYNHVYCKRK